MTKIHKRYYKSFVKTFDIKKIRSIRRLFLGTTGLLVFLGIISLGINAQMPEMCYIFDIHAIIGEAENIGKIPNGQRIIIPITGGEIKGNISGKILSGGADYQLVDTVNKRVALKAIYTILTNDSVYINVTNEGINSYAGSDYYFMTSPKFECDMDSPYGWLNNRLFVCRPIGFETDEIILRVWKVE